ncbi:chemotaxis protein CheC [Halorientalis sp. IM1011]|uniref:chemotaxis protein CheC n=1 Tax=Halorientalis sp. IM1011 TaxID=1932360 RepID=UPI00097CD279|nr:chemotaxis protein CheC [Halorientalis sp. IM1011]AQL43838.1 chemotaxis protein CheC [Halorientalis sp. IM1011]
MPLLIDVRKLRIINVLMESGAGNVADSLESLAGLDASVAVKSLSMVEPGDIPDDLGDERLFCASVKLTEPPYGYFVMTFGMETAENVAEHMTGRAVEGELNQFHESALQEMCNIFTSGFIDGLANTLGRSIEMGTPELEHGTGRELMAANLSHITDDSLAIVLDSQVDVTEPKQAFRIRIFLVPDPGAFVNVLDHLEVEDIRTEEPDVAGL